MRILPVTGDLPAIVVPPPAVPPAGHPPPAQQRVVEASARAGRADSEQTAGHRPPRTPLPFFDPPLIAQRAALGLPVGTLIAEFAASARISYAAASAAVDEQLSQQDG